MSSVRESEYEELPNFLRGASGHLRWRFTLALALSLICIEAAGASNADAPATPNRGSMPTADQDSFVASEPGITVSQWQQLFDDVKGTPGAQVGGQGPMLVTISVRSPDENAVYMFTQAAHPAHPAYLKVFSTNASGRPTRIVGNYAGSRTEFEKWVRSFLAFARENKK